PPSESSEATRHREPPRQFNSVTVIALVVALAALALAGWTLYRSEFSKTSYSDTQRADAKVKVCAAMDVVRKGVSLNTNLQPPGGPTDVAGSLPRARTAAEAPHAAGA